MGVLTFRALLDYLVEKAEMLDLDCVEILIRRGLLKRDQFANARLSRRILLWHVHRFQCAWCVLLFIWRQLRIRRSMPSYSNTYSDKKMFAVLDF